MRIVSTDPGMNRWRFATFWLTLFAAKTESLVSSTPEQTLGVRIKAIPCGDEASTSANNSPTERPRAGSPRRSRPYRISAMLSRLPVAGFSGFRRQPPPSCFPRTSRPLTTAQHCNHSWTGGDRYLSGTCPQLRYRLFYGHARQTEVNSPPPQIGSLTGTADIRQ